MLNLFDKKVTIYNDIASDGTNPRRFDRFVIDKCTVQGGFVQKSDGTIQNIVNSKSVITKDIIHYLPPEDYKWLPACEAENHYTVQIGDFIVFDEVLDVVTNGSEYAALQRKYAKNGMLVTAVTPFIFGSYVDNIAITSA